MAIGYVAVHNRVRRAFGRAADRECYSCGGVASNWAYDYTDPSPLIDERGRPYSLDLSRYQPMCMSCHKMHDQDQRGRALCGTEGGYYRHRRLGEPTCQACRDSHAAVARAATAKRAAVRRSAQSNPVPEVTR